MSFWTDSKDEHQKIAKTFHQNIEYTHPDFITSNNMCTCMDFANQCGWAATSVKYYTYTGPNIQNIK